MGGHGFLPPSTSRIHTANVKTYPRYLGCKSRDAEMGPDPLASTGIPPFEGPPPPPPPTDFNFTFPTNGTNFTVGTNETFLPWGPIPTDAGRSLQADIVACAVITWLIALGFVVVRFYTRGKLNNVLGASDWCIIPALVFAAGVMASSLEQMARGAGRHAWEADWMQMSALERAAWYGILFYNLSLTFSRISILLLYRRIFTYSWAKRAIQIVLVLVVLIGIWLVVSVCTACIPLEAFWNWSLFFTQEVYCQPGNIWWANAALHIVSDLVIMALPMPVLSALKLPRRQKYALVGVFALGFFVCIVSITRLVYLIDIVKKAGYDATYTSAQMIYWTSVEVSAAICCACLMTLKPLIQRLFPRLLSPNSGSKIQRENSSLQWIDPITGHPIRRDSRQSFIGLAAQLGRRGSRRLSETSDKTSSKRKGSLLRQVEEHEGGLPLVNNNNGLADYKLNRSVMHGDLESQQTCSVSAGARGGSSLHPSNTPDHHNEDDDDISPLDTTSGGRSPGSGSLRAPPRAHLRLSIQVTRSVKVEKHPRSPQPGETFGGVNVGRTPPPRRRSDHADDDEDEEEDSDEDEYDLPESPRGTRMTRMSQREDRDRDYRGEKVGSVARRGGV
uniref:Rhodopsin domain-containing protein n=1 Tax=Podospora anserina (strain S / ATCC MYA-4624 / DSM 980 / FGSC 10383) TaxID=515849 RepID=A0A090CD19_PODAN|nr:Putative protein of unknown function [Podospora anserina S mat+]